MGHSTLTMTLRYTHMTEGAMSEAIVTLEETRQRKVNTSTVPKNGLDA